MSHPAAAAPAEPHVMQTYGRLPIALSHGKGCWVWDTEGRKYLDGLGGGSLFPSEPKARWNALTEQSYGDGLLDAALAARYEGLLRSEEQRWQRWIDGQLAKVHATLDLIEGKAAGFGNRVDIGTITFYCALSYLDLRFTDLNWREGRPQAAAWFAKIAERPAFGGQKLG